MNNQIRLSSIADSPKITTGFGVVANQILSYLHNNGFEVNSLGTMDTSLDIEGKLPYTFFPAGNLDTPDKLLNTFSMFLVNSRPDVIFMMYDPGTLHSYLWSILELRKLNLIHNNIPIVIYTPIEGIPIPLSTAELFADLLEINGKIILYSPGAVKLVEQKFPQLEGKLEWAMHGLDHANFRKYDKQERELVRTKAGFTDTDFVVGSFGVNKRTKGFDTIIYTARCLKDMGQNKDIKFYLHTSSDKPVLAGYNLKQMAYDYDVEDMIIFKPEQHEKPEQYVNGIDRHIQNENDGIAGLNFIDRLNMLDCYLDLSQVEGWGLPPHEAMRCGIPTISINDGGIRSEIYHGGVMWLEPLPFRIWTTWHNGVKLAQIDPKDAAEAIIAFKNSPVSMRKVWSDWALENANKYNWLPTQEKITKIIEGVL